LSIYRVYEGIENAIMTGVEACRKKAV